jgi:hypothetical protein
VIAVTSCTVQPYLASRRDAALRNPCAQQWGSPASLHRALNQLPNPAGVKGFPNSVTRNVMLVFGVSAMIHSSSGSVELHAGLLLIDVNVAVTDVLAAHCDHIAAPLPGGQL